MPILPGRPGKIIAVHLNYEGRMAERGWRPEFPSYFLKPATSVAASGDVLERPAGTELLGFEGEIALIVVRRARRVTPATAWSHLSGVTAANDFGVFDLRWADRGSNLRAKGGDGFTPLGPTVLDAAELDPTALRLRTWVNGALRQEATAAELAFPFADLIADLSQLITLEPGDVVLTGTPSGASVACPATSSRSRSACRAARPPGGWSPASPRAPTHCPPTARLRGLRTSSGPRRGGAGPQPGWNRSSSSPASSARPWPASRWLPCPRCCASVATTTCRSTG